MTKMPSDEGPLAYMARIRSELPRHDAAATSITVDALEDGLVYIDVVGGSVRASICLLPDELRELLEKLQQAAPGTAGGAPEKCCRGGGYQCPLHTPDLVPKEK